jgi:hypothetical protein
MAAAIAHAQSPLRGIQQRAGLTRIAGRRRITIRETRSDQIAIPDGVREGDLLGYDSGSLR